MAQVYFLEINYVLESRGLEAPFFVGPYRSEREAISRSKTLNMRPLSVKQLVNVREMSADEIDSERVLVAGTRCFNRELFPAISESGEVDNAQKEHYLPADYFESGAELV
ncbi:hypothetical protein JNK13_07140 [bacterium]|nr:hypothetical protein [bacterium]